MKKFMFLFVVIFVSGILCEEATTEKKITTEKKEEIAEVKPEVKPEVKSEVKPEVKSGATAEDKKLEVCVYFESLCPDSFQFIKEQLYPNYKDVASYIDLNLIPFGKSQSIENGTKFNCHHGSQECKGNKILSCAYERLPDKVKQVEFTKCFMEIFKIERNNTEEFGQKCAKDVNLDPKGILDCYNSEEGLQHQLKAEKSTKVISPKSVPTIVYDEKFDQTLQDSSLTKFKEVVCELAKKTHPEACQVQPVEPL